MSGVRLEDTNLSHAHLEKAILARARLERANLEHAVDGPAQPASHTLDLGTPCQGSSSLSACLLLPDLTN